MNADFKLSESISKILLNQVDSPNDSEKSFDESLILNRIQVWKIIDSFSEWPLDIYIILISQSSQLGMCSLNPKL